MKISSNIKCLRELKKLSQESLAEDLNITRSRLGAYEEARNEPPIEILIRLSEYFQVSIDALIKADLRKTDVNAMIKLGSNRMLLPIMIDKENNDTIEVVTVKASAGYLSGYADPEFMEKLPFMELPFKVIGKQRAFPIKGDSMSPLSTGDFVVGKYLDTLKDLSDGKTYIILTRNDGIVYKRIFKQTDNLYTLHSDNKVYQPYNIKSSDILEIWEFTCSLKKSDCKNEEVSLETMMDLMLEMKNEIEHLKKK